MPSEYNITELGYPKIEENQKDYALIVNKENKFYHLFNFLAQEYGNDLEKLLKHFNNIIIFEFLLKVIKNTKVRNMIKILRFGITGAVFTVDFILHLKHYIKNQTTKEVSPHIKRLEAISDLLEIAKTSRSYGENLRHYSLELSSEIAMWILNSPNTENIKIIKYINIEDMKEVQSFHLDSEVKYIHPGVLLRYKDYKLLWSLELQYSYNSLHIRHSYLFGEEINKELIIQLRREILVEYIKNLNIKKNTLHFNYWSITSKPRRKSNIIINQFNVSALIEEIREVLSKKQKSATAFVGRQGVGKSAILKAVEEQVTEYPCFHLLPDDFDSPATIRDRFEVIKLLQPAIVMLEDADACNLKSKNKTAGEFLKCIDDINNDLMIYLMVTINDTSLVHYTIIDRPGRFDKVIQIKAPQTPEEVESVIQTKIKEMKPIYSNGSKFPKLKRTKSFEDLLQKCIKHNFTQAEITSAIVKQSLIDINIKLNKRGMKWDQIKPAHIISSFEKAVEKHKQTKEAIKNCNFNNMNPNLSLRKECIEKESQSCTTS